MLQRVRRTGVSRDHLTVAGEVDEGKRVVDETGEKIGEVIDVNDGVAFVDPHPSLTEKIMARLGTDEDEDRIERITDDEIVVSTAEFDDELGENTR